MFSSKFRFDEIGSSLLEADKLYSRKIKCICTDHYTRCSGEIRACRTETM